MRTAVVHIGCEKTGSTSIQEWLSARRAALREAGVFVPRSLRDPNHTGLVTACLDDGAFDAVKAHALAVSGRTEGDERDALAAAFAAELAGARFDTLVLTTELVSSRLHTPTEIARLVALVRPHVDRIRFVAYLRRQDALAVSRHGTALLNGHDRYDGLFADLSASSFLQVPSGRSVDDHREYYDFERVLDRFGGIDDAAVEVEVFDPPTGPDPVAAFCERLGRPIPLGEVPRANPSPSAEAQWLMARLNQEFRTSFPDGRYNLPYRALLRQLAAERRGRPRRAARADAEAFVARYAASNARVAERWLGRPRLFADGFDAWPEAVDDGFAAELEVELASWQARARALRSDLDRRPGPGPAAARQLLERAAAHERARAAAVRARASGAPDHLGDRLLVRVLGNDLPPRQALGQQRANLEFVLRHEPSPAGWRKLFVLNRPFDAAEAERCAALVRDAGHEILVRPFDDAEYARLACDASEFGGADYFTRPAFWSLDAAERLRARLWACAPKLRYAMDLNGARNEALRVGRELGAWTFVLDGGCFVAEEAFRQFDAELRSRPFAPYRVVPMIRVASNDEALRTSPLTGSSEEPQLAFHPTAAGTFDPRMPYGLRDKVELLERIGAPGPWDGWPRPTYFPTPLPTLPDRYWYRTSLAGVFRLSAGVAELAGAEADRERFQRRNLAVFQALRRLDLRTGAPDGGAIYGLDDL